MPRVENLHPLIGPSEGDMLIQPGEVSRVSDGVDAPNEEDSLGGELLVALVLGGDQTPEDRMDGLARILKGATRVGGFTILAAVVVVVCTLLIRLFLEDIC